MQELIVRRRKIANVFNGEPWIYPNAVVTDDLEAGLVHVFTEDGTHIGFGDYNPKATVRARLLTRAAEWPGDDAFVSFTLVRALQRRMRQGFSFQGGACRIVNGEGDGLSGLVIDSYGNTLIIDFISLGMCRRQELIESVLIEHMGDTTRIYRMGDDAAKREVCDPLPPVERELVFAENGILFRVDLSSSQKTGFYIDQRENRSLVARFAQGRRVLDLFAYQGAFSLSAIAGGAPSALAIDSSAPALEAARQNAIENNFALDTMEADVFKTLDDLVSDGPFDLIICDPPKLAPTKRDKRKALGAYRFLVDRCLRLLSPGGLFLICSCSQAIGLEDLRKLCVQVAKKKRVELDVIACGSQPSDHPWPIGFQTGNYLNSLLLERRSTLTDMC